MSFDKRYLLYETNTKSEYVDYGEVVSIINDRLINVNMGGQRDNDGNLVILEAVAVEGDFVPKIGDWVGIEWRNGIPVAIGGNGGLSIGLSNINDSVKIVSQSDLANNVINANHIRANSIEANHISANSINAIHISANSIQAKHIQADAIQSNHISSNTISARHIQAEAIQSGHISSNSIETRHISANSINAGHIMVDAIETRHISANAISAVKIASDSIVSRHISANTIQAKHISAGSITAIAISANAIQTQHISSNTIVASQIQTDAIQSRHISANSITSAHISAGSIQASDISAGAIQAQHISANQINSSHISAGTIDASKLSVSSREFGLLGQYFTYSAGSLNYFENFKGAQVDATLDFDWVAGSPSIVGQSDRFSVRWQGMLFSPEAGTYNFYTLADEGVKVWVDNQLIINGFTYTSAERVAPISLQKDKWYTVRIDYYEGTGNAKFKLQWQTPTGTKQVIPSMYLTQAQTVIDGGTILTNTITASSMKVGTITAESGILADASITTANIRSGNIVSAHIADAQIKSAHIASANILSAHIASANITDAHIVSLNAGKLTAGFIDVARLQAGSISGDKISGNSITGTHIQGNTITGDNIRAGAITTREISAGAITATQLQAGSVTSDIIRAGSITSQHISTIGLDAQSISVYNSQTGETLIGSGYIRVDGFDVGVVQSDNLIANGLFLTASSGFGFSRMNPMGQASEMNLGSRLAVIGGDEVWKINISTGTKQVVKIDAKSPVDISLDENGTFAYVTVQGDNTVVQLDAVNMTTTGKVLKAGHGPARIKEFGVHLGDHKHQMVLNSDPHDHNIPDSLIVIDAPPNSVNGDLYNHHFIPLGNGPYDMVLDGDKQMFITMKDQGDIVVIDMSEHDSSQWWVVNRIPISAYGTDNYHGGLGGQYGLKEVTGGDSAGQFDSTAGTTSMDHMGGGAHSHGGYTSTDGSLKKYEPRGIALSSDSDTLYVVDNANNEIVVVDKKGHAPYNALTGTHTDNVISGSMFTGQLTTGTGGGSPEDAKDGGVMPNGGPTTPYVRYRIPVGDAPESIEVVNGKVVVTLSGSGELAIIDEQDILDEINADRAYYGEYQSSGFYTNWNLFQSMRPLPTFNVTKVFLGSMPTQILASGNMVYISLVGQNKVACFDTTTNTVTQYLNVGANPNGLAISPDGQYLYVVNQGGAGDLTFIFPKGNYIGDPYLGLEGMVEYQGAEFWVPSRSDWVYDASGNIKSMSTVEFRINEPFLNEGGYAKLTAVGSDFQTAKIEQDVFNVTNYSNGNNIINTVGEILKQGNTSGGVTTFYPKAEWLNTPAPSNIKKVYYDASGNIVKTNLDKYTLYYGVNARLEYSGTALPSGGWIEANYTTRNNLYFKHHNGSILVSIENGSSPNFYSKFEIDEFVPKFVVFDNQQTDAFTPTDDGINETYTGLEYSLATNRAVNKTVTASATPTSGSLALVVNDVEIDSMHGDMTGMALPTSSGGVTLPSGLQNVKVDLGGTFMIGKIFVSHEYGADKVYNSTKTEVSEDGVLWTTVYDSAVSGTYNEKPMYHAPHDHTHYGKVISFPAKPVRYIRDWANGWVSGDGLTSGNTNQWTEIKAYGDWEVEKGYVWEQGSENEGQQIATNGKCFVSTDVSKAYVAFDIAIEYTSWWYMTYIVGPDFGKIGIEMPTLMNSNHFLHQYSQYVNKIAHRHIMSFPPSSTIMADASKDIKAGKHRVIIRQESGKVTLDRVRVEDFQFYANSSTLIPPKSSSSTFKRERIIAEQARWYQGKGRQTTYGAYDEPRRNPDTGLQDYSVPIKYRFRFKVDLSPTGSVEERGIAYVTSAIMETGKNPTHWRRSEASDSYPASRIEKWDGNQPHKTGIQTHHLANGAIRGAKIMAGAIMDYHISNYARIQEFKLDLNYPTHQHGHMMMMDMGGGMMMPMFHDNKAVLDSIMDWAGISGNYGVMDTLARGDHKHDNLYFPLTGGIISGNVNITGNIVISGTVDGVDISALSGTVTTINNTLTDHIGSGGNAHALASATGNGFMSSGDFTKLGTVAVSANNYVHPTTDGNKHVPATSTTNNGKYLGAGSTAGAISWKQIGFHEVTGNITSSQHGTHSDGTLHALASSSINGFMSVSDFNKLATVAVSANNYSHPTGDGNLHVPATSTSNNGKYLGAGPTAGSLSWKSIGFHEISGNITSTQHGVQTDGTLHAVANATTNGFMSFGDFNKLATVAISANNYVHPTTDGNKHVPANGTTNANKVLRASATAGTYTWGFVDRTEITNWSHSHTISEISDFASHMSGNYYKKTETYSSSEIDNMIVNAGDIKAGQANTFTNINTFSLAGLAVKIQPSASVTDTTQLFQVNNFSGNNLFYVNHGGDVYVKRNLIVEGTTQYQGTTQVDGDYSVSGNMTVKGNSYFGDASSDTTKVTGTLELASGGVFKRTGYYEEVHRRPLFGIAGDMQFNTDDITFSTVISNYGLDSYALPSKKANTTRYYRLYVVYSDDITSTQSSAGQKGTIRISNGSVNKDFDLPYSWGTHNGRRDWFSAYFTDLPTGNCDLQAKLAQAGNKLGIRWIELVAYDVY